MIILIACACDKANSSEEDMIGQDHVTYGIPKIWSKTFGGPASDMASASQQTNDGGYIIAGVTNSYGAGSSDAYLIKTDERGNELWSKTFGGRGNDTARAVHQTIDEGYIIAGRTDSYGAGFDDVYLIKTDESGNEQWSKTFGGMGYDTASAVKQTIDRGYIIAGQTNTYGTGFDDIYLIKTDESGNEQWSKTFGGSASDGASAVLQTVDGGYIIAGETSSYGAGPSDVYLIKTDEQGNEQWSRTFGGPLADVANSIQQIPGDDAYIVAGYAEINNMPMGSNQDVYLIKIDGEGNELWSTSFGASQFDERVQSVKSTPDGGYILAGHTEACGTNEWAAYLAKTDENGNESWSSDVSNAAAYYSVLSNTNGEYITAGFTFSLGTRESDVVLTKTNESNLQLRDSSSLDTTESSCIPADTTAPLNYKKALPSGHKLPPF